MRNDEARQEGEDNEKIIEEVITPIIQTWNPDNHCVRNQYRGKNNYGGGFQEESYWYDMRMYLHHNGFKYDEWHHEKWYKGYYEKWLEFKLDKKVNDEHNPTGNLAFESHADSYTRDVFMPSGILKTKSEIWIMRSHIGKYWVMDLHTILRLCFANDKYVSKRTGEHNDYGDSKVTTLLYCVSTTAIEKEGNYLDYGDDIKNIDLDKILFKNNNNWF